MYREQPDIAKKLLRAHIKAMQFAVDSPDVSMSIFANMSGKSIDVVEESWKNMIYDVNVDTASMKTFVSYLIEQEIITESIPDIDEFVDSAVDQSLLQEVL